MKPLAILATGMMTAVGLNAPASCAAMRCALDRFEETRFMDNRGEWIVGSSVPLDPPVRGRERLLRLATSVIAECHSQIPETNPRQVPILFCVAEQSRPGRPERLDASFITDAYKQLKLPVHPDSALIANGRVGGVEAIRRAAELIEQGNSSCLVVGTDSFLVGATLAHFESANRLLTSTNSDGFVPGEAGAAIWLGPVNDGAKQIHCLGVGFGQEKATVDSEEPLRADGLATALRAALTDAGCTYEKVDYRITDANGEQYRFKEASLALSRTMRVLKPEFDLWHPADCIGEIGAAIVPCALGVARAAALKKYAPGPGVICHFGNDDSARAAVVLRASSAGAA